MPLPPDTGPRWTSNPVTWCYAEYATVDSPFTHTIPLMLRSTVADAVATWQVASGLALRQVADDPARPADIRIGFARVATGAELGLTEWEDTESGAFMPGVRVELQDPEAQPIVRRWGDTYYRGSDVTFVQVVLHEFGHALGLGHSADYRSVMFGRLSRANRSLSAADVSAIRAIYPPQAFYPSQAPIAPQATRTIVFNQK